MSQDGASYKGWTKQAETVDLRSYLRPVWRFKWIVLAITVLAAGGSYAITSREHKTYMATSRVYVQNPDPAASVSSGPFFGPPTQQQLQDVATLFTAQAITNAVYHRLGLPIGSAGSVVVAPESTSSFIDVAASSRSPAFAQRLANYYVGAFVASQKAAAIAAAQHAAAAALITLRTLSPTNPSTQAERTTLLGDVAQYDTDINNPSSGVQQVYPALLPSAPVSPKPARDAIFAGVIGLLLGIAVAFAIELADRRLLRVASIPSLYGRSVLAVLPHVSKITPKDAQAGAPPEFVEVMRGLRVNVRLALDGRPPQTILVTSALPGEGKSVVARNLAFAYADAGERVLLIDCDLRRPNVARTFGVRPKFGLVQVLLGDASLSEAVVPVFPSDGGSKNGSANGVATGQRDPRAHGSVGVLAHGDRVENPGVLLAADAMAAMLAKARSQYDTVVLDTSPVLAVSDAIPLLDKVGAVLFVARLGMTTRDAAERLTGLGERVPDMRLLGVVVNDMRRSYMDPGYAAYFQDAYGYSRA